MKHRGLLSFTTGKSQWWQTLKPDRLKYLLPLQPCLMPEKGT